MREKVIKSIKELNEKLNNIDFKMFNYLIETTNAKLHKLFYEEINDDYERIKFEQFCEFSWEDFKYFVDENNCEIKFLGRTSSFYISNKYVEMFNENFSFSLNEFKQTYLKIIGEDFIQGLTLNEDMLYRYDYYIESLLAYFESEDDISDIQEMKENNYEEDYIENYLEWTLKTINTYSKAIEENPLEKILDGAIQCRKYLKDFKENQVENFKEFIKEDLEQIEELHNKEKEEDWKQYECLIDGFLYNFINNGNSKLYDIRKLVFDNYKEDYNVIQEKCKNINVSCKAISVDTYYRKESFNPKFI